MARLEPFLAQSQDAALVEQACSTCDCCIVSTRAYPSNRLANVIMLACFRSFRSGVFQTKREEPHSFQTKGPPGFRLAGPRAGLLNVAVKAKPHPRSPGPAGRHQRNFSRPPQQGAPFLR